MTYTVSSGTLNSTIPYHTIQLKCLKKRRVQEITASNRALLIQQLIGGRIVLMRVCQSQRQTILNICCDVFVDNCQFVMTCNACITVVMVC